MEREYWVLFQGDVYLDECFRVLENSLHRQVALLFGCSFFSLEKNDFFLYRLVLACFLPITQREQKTWIHPTRTEQNRPLYKQSRWNSEECLENRVLYLSIKYLSLRPSFFLFWMHFTIQTIQRDTKLFLLSNYFLIFFLVAQFLKQNTHSKQKSVF